MGDVLEHESTVPVGSLPAAVVARLAKEMPGLAVQEAERVEAHFFEIKVLIDGEEKEIVINAAGGIEDDDDEDEDDDHEHEHDGDDDDDDDHDD